MPDGVKVFTAEDGGKLGLIHGAPVGVPCVSQSNPPPMSAEYCVTGEPVPPAGSATDVVLFSFVMPLSAARWCW